MALLNREYVTDLTCLFLPRFVSIGEIGRAALYYRVQSLGRNPTPRLTPVRDSPIVPCLPNMISYLFFCEISNPFSNEVQPSLWQKAPEENRQNSKKGESKEREKRKIRSQPEEEVEEKKHQ